MDRLAFEAAQAKAEGISYGNWKAKQLDRDTKIRMATEKEHEKFPVCAGCGKPIPRGSRSRKYCGPECADRARQKQYRETKIRRREAAVIKKEV